MAGRHDESRRLQILTVADVPPLRLTLLTTATARPFGAKSVGELANRVAAAVANAVADAVGARCSRCP
jgi:CO/xanthine dehydrogenase Mo-binding subunit